MSAPILTSAAVVMCAHGGKVVLTPNSKVLLSGTPAAAWMPALPIAGCGFISPDVAVTLLPTSFSAKVLSNGQPLLLQTVGGVGTSGTPIAPATSAGQSKVIAR